MKNDTKFEIGDRVAKKDCLSLRGKIISTVTDDGLFGPISICEVIWEGNNHVSTIFESDLISESLLK